MWSPLPLPSSQLILLDMMPFEVPTKLCVCLSDCVCLSWTNAWCVCVCLEQTHDVYVYLSVSVCLSWTNAWCVCVSVCVARGKLWCYSSGAIHLVFWDRISHWPRSHQLTALGASFPSPLAPCLYVGSGSQIQVLTLSQQPLYWVDSLPSPFIALLTLKESLGAFSYGRET